LKSRQKHLTGTLHVAISYYVSLTMPCVTPRIWHVAI